MSIEPEQSDPTLPPAAPEPMPARRHYVKPLIVGVAFVAVTAGLFVYRLDRENQAPPPPVTPASYDFQAGQCFNRDQIEGAGHSAPLDCAQPHTAEVYAVEPLSGDAYPGQTVVEALGHRKCPAESAKALTPDTNYSGVTTAFLYPLENPWAHGDRSIKCFFYRQDKLPMTGRVKDSGLPYTPEQKHYRDTVKAYDAILGEEDPTVGWTAERDVVARSIPVVQQEIAALQAGPWPHEFGGTMKDLTAAKQVELADRQRAAAATDEGTFKHALDDATAHSGSENDRTVKATLGLAPA
ncbi:septum formation family protein [Kutzneria sp. 744]|uniref:septum formation family protein n=1 Tax=Kutzneria sp. (strain 744) TaxID=345341 RepID=UPI0003EEC72F|nr:septum formation family protein [Kutzneria sp. 744]EWM14426.1 mucin-2 [Kutzneria sp. 744]